MKTVNVRGDDLPNAEWLKTINDFNGLCAYCSEAKYEQIDHFIPSSKGGKTVITNCLPACTSCNRKKSNATGNVLVAMFGSQVIIRLQDYLASRSDSPSEFVSELEQQKPPIRTRLIIKEIAQAKGIKQSDLAEKSGVTAQLVNRYWNYPMQRVELDALVKIARALGVKLADLIEVEGEDAA